MDTHHVFLGVLVVVGVVNVLASLDEKKNRRLIWITKPLLMPLVILFVLTRAAVVPGWIVAGLCFGLAGDVFLMLPGEKEHNFMLGLASFLVNHLLYVAAFVLSAGGLAAAPGWVWTLALPLAAFGAVIYRLLAPGLGKLKGPVIVYMAVILAMVMAALLRLGAVPPGSFWIVLAGALSFVFSDSVLAWDRFRRRLPAGRAVVMATYISAQFMIAAGFVF